ncbi:hypothetical protein EAG_12953 [Camponotus floridanus]|uniref:Uncharacterized protein n=1 Tax=Camponotus floridanus TaxID=104421 RepID=E2ANB8_CAMFO|nr:hypothetical protein EAG_12953 [Camponotus floridanus]
MHYPARIATDSTSSSSLQLESTRKMNSTSVLQSSDGTSKISSRIEGQIGDRESKKRSSLNRMFRPSFLAKHPIIDISSLDYKTYRHELVEAALKKRYDDSQPPGDVVLNSLHLNPADSVIGVRLNDRYDHSLFDFVEEYYDTAEATRNVERLHPMDHFLSKGASRPRTIEKETETIPDKSPEYRPRAREDDRNYFPENDNSNFAQLPGMDNNGNPYVTRSLSRSISEDNISTIARSDLNSKLSRKETIPPRSRERADKARLGSSMEGNNSPRFADPNTRKESSGMKDRPASAGNATLPPKGCALSRAVTLPVRQKRATESPRPETGRWRDSKENPEDYPTGFSSPNKHHAQAGRSNLLSASSSEVASLCSDSSSKRRCDKMSHRSRESSISPRSCASSRPPWLSTNFRGTSFNRKYGNITKDPAKYTRPATSTRESGLSRRPVVSSRQDRSRESDASRNSGSLRRRAASFIASREREFTGASIEKRREHLTTSPRCQRDKLRDVGSAARAESNERERTLKTPDSTGEGISAITRDNVASSLLSGARTRVYPTSRVAVASAPAPAPAGVAASPTRATMEPRLTSRRDEGARKERGSALPGCSESPSVARDEWKRSAKLNRGGRRRLRSAENPSKGASLSPKIELSAEVLNPADDTGKSAIPDGGKLAEQVITRIDPRGNLKTAGESAETRLVSNIEAVTKDGRSGNVNDAVRSKVPKIMRNLPADALTDANNLPKSDRSGVSTSHPAGRDANSEAKSGLNGAKLNSRSNDTVDKMKGDGSAISKGSWVLRESGTVDDEAETRERDIAGRINPDEELQLPRRDSKMDLVMNSGLKRYIEIVKQTLQNDDIDNNKEDVVSLASLSLSDAILSEQKTSLSPEETQELQNVLNRIEKNPELLHKQSFPNMRNTV